MDDRGRNGDDADRLMVGAVREVHGVDRWTLRDLHRIFFPRRHETFLVMDREWLAGCVASWERRGLIEPAPGPRGGAGWKCRHA